jgi:ABC-2 type transport system ATP-binding protein
LSGFPGRVSGCGLRSNEMVAMIEVKNLTKRFGRVKAIDGVSFKVGKGEIVGLLGPNGAGKTTTLRILSCYLPATGGDVIVGGEDVFTDSLAVRGKVGYLPENVPLYLDMRIREYLRFRGALKGLRGKHLRERIHVVLEQCGLKEQRKVVIGRLSKGFRQRVGLADCLLHEPECLILDEPTIGLDPNQIRHIRELIRGLAKQHTVLISTHILPEVEMLCERVLIMNAGRIVASDTPAALVGLMKGNEHVAIEVLGSRRAVIEAFERIPGIESLTCEPMGEWSRLVCQCQKAEDVRPEMFKVVCKHEWQVRELTTERRNLEDVFVAITKGEFQAGTQGSEAGDA